MAVQAVATFHHSKTIEGIWHSVCLCCFRTVANSFSEATLAPEESTHTCNPMDFFTTSSSTGLRDHWLVAKEIFS
jgi:hypothetical protein